MEHLLRLVVSSSPKQHPRQARLRKSEVLQIARRPRGRSGGSEDRLSRFQPSELGERRSAQDRHVQKPALFRRAPPVVGRAPKRRLGVSYPPSLDQHFREREGPCPGIAPVLPARQCADGLTQHAFSRGMSARLNQLNAGLHPALQACEFFGGRPKRQSGRATTRGNTLVDVVRHRLLRCANTAVPLPPQQAHKTPGPATRLLGRATDLEFVCSGHRRGPHGPFERIHRQRLHSKALHRRHLLGADKQQDVRPLRRKRRADQRRPSHSALPLLYEKQTSARQGLGEPGDKSGRYGHESAESRHSRELADSGRLSGTRRAPQGCDSRTRAGRGLKQLTEHSDGPARLNNDGARRIRRIGASRVRTVGKIAGVGPWQEHRAPWRVSERSGRIRPLRQPARPEDRGGTRPHMVRGRHRGRPVCVTPPRFEALRLAEHTVIDQSCEYRMVEFLQRLASRNPPPLFVLPARGGYRQNDLLSSCQIGRHVPVALQESIGEQLHADSLQCPCGARSPPREIAGHGHRCPPGARK